MKHQSEPTLSNLLERYDHELAMHRKSRLWFLSRKAWVARANRNLLRQLIHDGGIEEKMGLKNGDPNDEPIRTTGLETLLDNPLNRAFFEKHFHPITKTLPEDIFIVAYPKSGVTWLTYLVAGMRFGFEAGNSKLALVDELIPDVHAFPVYKRHATPMFFKSHAKPTDQYKNVIYLLRDGRDAMVSYWHFHQALHGPIDFLTFIRDENISPCKWHEHVTAWTSNPYNARMLIVKYEDLLRDPLTVLERVCEFSGIAPNRAAIELSIEHSSFSKLQNREKVDGLRWLDTKPGIKDRKFFRRGVANSYKDEMPEEVLSVFMSEASQVLEKHGYIEPSGL